jgi:hypothetical protein
MDLAATVLRTLHITAGVAALLVFWVPLVVTKGNRVHRRVGWVYVTAMFVAAATAMLIAPIRLIQGPREGWGTPLFLAYIALLSFTAAFYGVRVLGQKKRRDTHRAVTDWAPPLLLVVSTIAIASYGIASEFRLALYFAPVGFLVALPQLRALRRKPESKTWWLVEHLSAMLVSCIATVTAFLVVNAGRIDAATHPLVWLGPTAIGTALIVYWRRRYATSARSASPTSDPAS